MSSFMSPLRPRPRVNLMPTADEMLGRPPKMDPLFSSEDGGMEPVEPGGIGPRPVSADLANKFGFSWGTPTAQTDDRAARANFLSHPTDVSGELMDYIPEPKIGDADYGDWRKGMSRDSQNRSISNFNSLSLRQSQEERARIDAANAARETGIVSEQAMSARLQRQAAEQAFFERTGMPYDEKLASKIREFDQEQAEDEGYQNDIADVDAAEQTALASLPPSPPDPILVGLDPKSPMAQAMSIAKSAADAKRTAIKAHFDTERRNRLMIMAIRAGATSPGAAFAQPKQTPGIDPETGLPVPPTPQ